MNENIKGKVIIAGAGPGDPELITVKAIRALMSADVVLTDRLVSAEILATYVPAAAQIIYVGKQYGKNGSIAQQDINQLLLQHAHDGKTVVRLKGGDVAFFSNVLDELATLAAAKIPFEIIPGITAASGASASAGIPLTARGYATGVKFLTYYRTDIVSVEEWRTLATSDDTLVFYMSSSTIRKAVEQLIAAGIPADKEMAVIEQATTPAQKVTTYRLPDFIKNGNDIEFASPTLVIVGAVVTLHQQFRWQANQNEQHNCFTPVNHWEPTLVDLENSRNYVR
jgi:uroporphyrin-III C-methyltransferase